MRDRRMLFGVSDIAAPRLTSLLIVVGGVAALLMVALQVSHEARVGVPLVDWMTYARAFERLANGGHIYAAAQLDGPYSMPSTVVSGYSYPPASVLVLAPFVWLPVGPIPWIVLNARNSLTGLWAVARHELGSWGPMGFGLALVGLGISPALGSGIAVANVNVGLAGMLAWAW